MNDNQKFVAGLLLGAAAGAGVALFLSSEKGKALLTEVAEKGHEMKDGFSSRLQELQQSFADLVEKGRLLVDEMDQQMKQTNV